MTTTAKLIRLSRKIAELQVEFARLKASVSESAPGVTVYSVRPSRVRGHTRRGFWAVRVNGRAKA